MQQLDTYQRLEAVEQRNTVTPVDNQLYSRRQFMRLMLGGGIVLTLPSFATGEEKQVAVTDPEVLAALESLFRQPDAAVRRLEKPGKDWQTMRVAFDQQWQPKAETMLHVHETGWVDNERTSRKETGKSTWPGSASGFQVSYNDDNYLLSNVHVLSQIPQALRSKEMTFNEQMDVAAVPMSAVQRCSGDKYDLPMAKLSTEITPQNLAGRTVRIRAMGADLFEVEGKAFRMPVCSGGQKICNDCTSYFCVKVTNKDIADHRPFQGMSGAPVVDTESGDVVGIFHSAPTMTQPKTGKKSVLMWFSGPTALQSVFPKEAEKAAVDQ